MLSAIRQKNAALGLRREAAANPSRKLKFFRLRSATISPQLTGRHPAISQGSEIVRPADLVRPIPIPRRSTAPPSVAKLIAANTSCRASLLIRRSAIAELDPEWSRITGDFFRGRFALGDEADGRGAARQFELASSGRQRSGAPHAHAPGILRDGLSRWPVGFAAEWPARVFGLNRAPRNGGGLRNGPNLSPEPGRPQP